VGCGVEVQDMLGSAHELMMMGLWIMGLLYVLIWGFWLLFVLGFTQIE